MDYRNHVITLGSRTKRDGGGKKEEEKKIGLTVISNVEEAIGLWKGKPIKERIETAVRLIVGLRGCSSYLFGGHLLRVGQ